MWVTKIFTKRLTMDKNCRFVYRWYLYATDTWRLKKNALRIVSMYAKEKRYKVTLLRKAK